MHVFLYVVAAALILVGLAGAVVPMLPGIPIIFGGIWLIAAVDHYQHVGSGWLIGIGIIAAVGLILDFAAAALGAKRVGASAQAIAGALIGTVVGLFLGIPGLIFGPFVGALIGEYLAGRTLERSAHVGIATWAGLVFGTLMKLAASIMMVVLFAAAWWWNGSR
ncbi:MAG TPA: DUF456 domain-containing protein [Steroidobacteraceae bacterium]|jgi:hypothetical protein|nr:DUF456 domain-containing protein [Steroidobacteraceae bacterium]